MIKSKLFTFTILALLFIANFTGIIHIGISSGESWLSGWSYRKSHVINSATGAGTNYQVRVEVCYTANAQEPETMIPLITVVSTLPAPSGHSFISGQSATYWDGTYLHVWYGCGKGDSSTDNIFYTNTSNFVNWATPTLVIDRSEGIRDPTSIVVGDYIYLFAQCFDNSNYHPIRLYKISKTANFADSNSYTYVGAPIDMGSSGQFDEGRVASPCVVRIGSTYWMAYEALTEAGVFSIGRAYATNIEGPWTKDGQMRNSQGNVIYAPSGSTYDFVPDNFAGENTLSIHYKNGSNAVKMRYMKGDIPNNNMTLSSTDIKPNDSYEEHNGFSDVGFINGLFTFLCCQPYDGPKLYQQSADMTFLNQHCRTDFGDVRFTDDDGVTELDYWMETKVDGSYAVFWVEVADSLSSNPATIYIYYGKTDATTTSNGEDTFLFFDDFPGTTYDTSKWQVVGSPTITVSNGELNIQRSSYSGSESVHGLRSKTFQTDEKRVIVKAKTSTFSDTCKVRIDADYYSVQRADEINFESSASKINLQCDRRDAGGGISTTVMLEGASSGTYYTFYMTRWGSTYLKGWLNAEYKGQVTSNVNDGSTYLGLSVGEWGSHGTIVGTYDWIAIAKYVDPEPSHLGWGSEAQNTYSLTVSVVGGGSVSLNNSGPYYFGDVVALTAVPSAGWSFSGWSGDLTGSISPALITIDGGKAVTATFAQNFYMPFSIISNSTISELAFNSTSKMISFTVSGPPGTIGYTNVTIAKTLIQDIDGLQIYLDGNQINYTVTFTDYYWLIHFTYTHSTHKVLIILNSTNANSPNAHSPESITILSSITILIIAAILLVYRKVRKKIT